MGTGAEVSTAGHKAIDINDGNTDNDTRALSQIPQIINIPDSNNENVQPRQYV